MRAEPSVSGEVPPDVRFLADLRRLYEDAGSPAYKTLTRRGDERSVKLSPQRLSDWLTGKNLPTDERTLRFLIGFLGAEAGRRGRRSEQWHVWRQRWRAARAHRRAGGEVQGVDQPWHRPALDAGDPDLPALLLARFQVVPYQLPEVVDEFAAWCDGPEPLAVSYLEAPGGAGKTRYAIDVCQVQAGEGWVAGFVRLDDRRADTADGDRLLVVDDFGASQAELLADRLEGISCSPSGRVRVLLLARPAEYPGRALSHLRECFGERARDDVWAAVDKARVAALPTLDDAAKRKLFDAAVATFGPLLRPGAAPTSFRAAEAAEVGRLRWPLDVLCAALDAVRTGPVSRGTAACWSGANGRRTGSFPGLTGGGRSTASRCSTNCTTWGSSCSRTGATWTPRGTGWPGS